MTKKDNLNNLTEAINQRDPIIFGDCSLAAYDEHEGLRYFADLTVEQFEQLVEQGFIDLEEEVNLQPKYKVFLAFMREFQGYCAAGSAVARDNQFFIRIDCLEKPGGADSDRELEQFVKLSLRADDYLISPRKLFSWFD